MTRSNLEPRVGIRIKMLHDPQTEHCQAYYYENFEELLKKSGTAQELEKRFLRFAKKCFPGLKTIMHIREPDFLRTEQLR